MKTLFLLRHAKSSWDDPDLKDFERPLAERGLGDIPVMAERILSRKKSLDSITCSPALRTKSTAQLLAAQLKFPADEIGSNPELYFAGSSMFLKAASLVDEHCESAMLVGHNPAITDFVNEMANAEIENIPTCGLVELSLPIENWSDIQFGSATLVDFDYPKKCHDEL
ncbi:MAG: phosphohistidine phosphatase [SAR86 cluster bacterium]|uniref:Phosphohistidine phosphatase n=1 Tax=SAR86 cluster bacterium TaxID=2030880 RepID=A0A2A5AXB7_9GAMM|nr:MAG: phosphohistidine phosphatase [SAR86 cluster bacterium]